MTPHMIAYASRNRAMGVMWRSRIVEPARVALSNMIKRGEKRGVLRRVLTGDCYCAAVGAYDLSPCVREQGWW